MKLLWSLQAGIAVALLVWTGLTLTLQWTVRAQTIPERVSVQAEQVRTLQDGQKSLKDSVDKLNGSIQDLDKKMSRMEGIGFGGMALLSVLSFLNVLEQRRNRSHTFKVKAVGGGEE